jgi:hypothetical protein
MVMYYGNIPTCATFEMLSPALVHCSARRTLQLPGAPLYLCWMSETIDSLQTRRSLGTGQPGSLSAVLLAKRSRTALSEPTFRNWLTLIARSANTCLHRIRVALQTRMLCLVDEPKRTCWWLDVSLAWTQASSQISVKVTAMQQCDGATDKARYTTPGVCARS